MPQFFLRFTLYCLAISLIISCKKDPVNGANPGGTAHYSFEGAPGTCSTPVIAGIYSAGFTMSAANTVTFTVLVSVKGTYSMNSTSVNGVYFSGAGVFTATGPQTVVLTGNGIPVRSGSFSFVPATSNTCNFSVSFSARPPAAVFTYAGAPGNCTAPVIRGTYSTGAGLGTGNYVDLAVHVTSPGAYTINTNNTNGIGFSGSGVFTAPGAQVVRLIGNGTPTAPGSFAYTPVGNGCSFNITVTGPPLASFTYNGAPGNCTGPVINGIYAKGLILNGSNTVVLGVHVSVIGSYAVSTNSANGIIFSGSGTFTTTGANTITLSSTNTPMDAGTFSYAAPGGCSFDIIYTSVTPSYIDFLICTIDGVVYNFNDLMIGASDQSGSPYTFHVEGVQTGGTDHFFIELLDINNPIVAGNYNNLSASSLNKNCQITYSSGSGTWGSSFLNANTFVVNLTSISATKATGTFSGTMYNNLGTGTNTKSITAGSFSISY